MAALFYVALGGALGACLRYGAGVMALRAAGLGGAYATLFVNVAGSFAMGLLFAWLTSRAAPVATTPAYLFLGVGLLGGFTTFSAFSLETVQMLNQGEVLRAGGYMTVSAIASVGALWLAFALARQVPA